MERNVAILMADLSGYTAMTDVHGGASAAQLVDKYMQLVDRSIVGSTKVMQRVGDQIVLLAEVPNDIVETAKKLITCIHAEHHFLSIHAGIHYGTVFIEKGNLFGSTVNIASRIMNMAEKGQILFSKELLEQLQTDKYSYKLLGDFAFKNVMNTVTVYQLLADSLEQRHIDPVCKMQIDPTRTKYTYQFNNTEYHFCSVRCRYIFQGKPETFLK